MTATKVCDHMTDQSAKTTIAPSPMQAFNSTTAASGAAGETFTGEVFTGERALFQARNLTLDGCVFEAGESPLKESCDLTIRDTTFRWKYPLWYAQNIDVENSMWTLDARAGVWYSRNLTIRNSTIGAPKNFRRTTNLLLEDVSLAHAEETLWNCDQVTLRRVDAVGDYFAMNSTNLQVEGLRLDGNYSFDGCRNVTVSNSQLLSKDAFWNCENVTVNNSTISGEYVGWNSKNLTFNNCTISSLQGLCYIDGLTLNNCRLIDTTLAFEYCTNIDAVLTSPVRSVLNPVSGSISAPNIGEVIQNDPNLDTSRVRIVQTGMQ